jgi:hypothetical protein
LLQSGKQKDEGLDESHRSPAFLHVSARTVRLAIDAGELQAEQPLWDGPWLVNGQELKSDNAQRLKLRAQRGGRRPAIPSENQNDLQSSSTLEAMLSNGHERGSPYGAR